MLFPCNIDKASFTSRSLHFLFYFFIISSIRSSLFLMFFFFSIFSPRSMPTSPFSRFLSSSCSFFPFLSLVLFSQTTLLPSIFLSLSSTITTVTVLSRKSIFPPRPYKDYKTPFSFLFSHFDFHFTSRKAILLPSTFRSHHIARCTLFLLIAIVLLLLFFITHILLF